MEQSWKFAKRHDLPQNTPSRSSILALTNHGHEALRRLVAALNSEPSNNTDPPDITLLSVQLKGWPTCRRLSLIEWGTTTFDTKQLFTTPADDNLQIYSHKIQRTSAHGHLCASALGFHFGQTSHGEMWELPLAINSTFSSLTKETILIGSGIWGMLNEAAKYKINLENYPHIRGVVDVSVLCAQVFRAVGTLSQVMTYMGIPHVGKSIGCAGNEARFVLLIMFGLLWRRETSGGEKETEARLSVLHDISRRRRKGIKREE